MDKMPTILVILGWRLFFYANEGNEPIHVHCRKGDMECKYWLNRENFDLDEAFAYNMSPRDKRQIRMVPGVGPSEVVDMEQIIADSGL